MVNPIVKRFSDESIGEEGVSQCFTFSRKFGNRSYYGHKLIQKRKATNKFRRLVYPYN